MKPIEHSKILITGVTRNGSQTIIKDLEKISAAFNISKSLKFLIIESDSDDNTVNILQELKQNNDNLNYISLGNLSTQFPLRTDRIAQCRNIYVSEISLNPLYEDIDYVAVVDLDGINTEISSNAITTCWVYDNWLAMTANQSGPYYDIWALRHNLWSPNDCWKQYKFLNHYNNNSQDNLIHSVYSRMIRIPENSQIIKVDSAFGGLGIYVKSIFNSCTYIGLTENGEEICEHVYFNHCINRLGGNIYINPKLINANYTEHTTHLINSSPNTLVNSKYGKIIINKNDKYIGKHIAEKGYWAEEDIKIIRKLLELQLSRKNYLVFYDVGANIGTHSLAIAKIFGSKVSIRAFEAQRMIYNMLCGSVALNGLFSINCHNNAVSNLSNQIIEMKVPDYHSENNFGGLELIEPLISDNHDLIHIGNEKITTVTIDSFNENIDFIKMNIEGMEDKAIQGAISSIEKSRPICYIEIHKTDSEFIFSFFRNLDYIGYRNGSDLITIPNEFGINISGLSKVF